MKWLDKLKGKGVEPASDNQIGFIRTRVAERTPHQTEPVLAAFGVLGQVDDDEVMHALGREKASHLIDALLDLEGCTEPQQRYVAMMLRDLGDWIRVGNEPSQATINTYYEMVDLLEPYFSRESVEHGPLDWKMLSKRQASEVIATMKPDYELARNEDD